MVSAAAKHGGPFRWTDPDFLMTGGAGCDTFAPGTQCPGMTDIEYRTEFSLWAVAAASMLVAVRPQFFVSGLEKSRLDALRTQRWGRRPT